MKTTRKQPRANGRRRAIVVEAMEPRVLFSFVIYGNSIYSVQSEADAGGGNPQTATANPAHTADSLNRAASGGYPAISASAVSNASSQASAQQLVFHADATESDPSSPPLHYSDASASGSSGDSFTLTAAATVQIDGTVSGSGGGVATIVFNNFDGDATVSSNNATGVHQSLFLSAGNYEVSVHALAPSDNDNASASADLTLTLGATAPKAPKITSASGVTFQRGQFGQFTVTTSGAPTPSLSETAILPDGISFVDNGDGTATLSGTPATSDATGTYRLILTASNGTSPDANQFFALKIGGAAQPTGIAPKITSASKIAYSYGVPATFEVRTTGSPAAALSITGNLPTGISFQDNGDGSGSFFGTASGTAGTYKIVLHADNGVGKAKTQTITIKVSGIAPKFTSAAKATFALGTAATFAITTTGAPTAALTQSGHLPPGMSFQDNGDGTATITGTPTVSGSYKVILHASNGVGRARTQTLTLVIPAPPRTPRS